MKLKKLIPVLIVMLIASFSLQSCIGSFSLTNKVLTWNRNVSNKFVNELVFFAFWVLPVYEVTAVADLLVINSIEFWSGNTPLEAHNQVIATDEGNYYINAYDTGYKVISPDGSVLDFSFDIESQVWSLCKDDGQKLEFLKYKDPSHVQLPNFEGDFVDVELSPCGVNQYKDLISQPLMAQNQ